MVKKLEAIYKMDKRHIKNISIEYSVGATIGWD